MTINRVTLVGCVGAHLTTKQLKNGATRVALRIATHESNNRTTWHNVAAYNDTAAYAVANFVKGSRIMVEGQLTYLPYPDASGRRHYAREKEWFRRAFEIAIHNTGLDHIKIPYNVYRNKSKDQANGCYINYLQMATP